MPGILEQLPSNKSLGSIVKIDSNTLPVGQFQDLGSTAAGLSSSVQSIKTGKSLTGVSLNGPPAGLTKDGVLSAVNQPLNKLKGINANSALGDVSADRLPVNLPAPADAGLGDLNGHISKIAGAIVPSPQVSVPPSPGGDILSVNTAAVSDDLRKLAAASANAPLRLLNGVLKVGRQFVVTVTNPTTLQQITLQSLDEIYTQQLLNLEARLPLSSLDSAVKIFGKGDGAFTAQYKLLLDEIEILDPKNIDRLTSILGDGRNKFQPWVTSFAEANKTLGYYAAGDTASLTTALNNCLDLTGTGAVLLQPLFDDFRDNATSILKEIEAPVVALGDLAGKITDYLNQAGATAEQTAQSVADTLKTNLASAEQFLKDVQKTVQDLEKQITDFINGVKDQVAPIVGGVKDAISGIGTAIEQFFTQIEELKQKLDEAVRKFKDEADQKVTDVFNALAAEIRKLLSQITDVLNRPEVKDALDACRQGIDKFKATVDQASLKPVFDLVIAKTGEVETKINSIDVAKMGTPQKVALKVGAKVIEQVKVDEILKPELKEAFEQIRAPLADLITLLKDKALQVEAQIDAFEPGKIVADFVAPPFNSLLDILDSVRPSQLLKPLKDANAKLTDLVEELNPQKLIDEVEKLYDQLGDTLKVFDPTPLTRLIGDAADVAVSALGRIRDRDLPSIVDAIKRAVSLESLMAKTGLQEIAKADFWDTLRYFLGGGCLDEVTSGIDQVGKTLAGQVATLDFSHVMDVLKEVVTAIDNQAKADGALMKKRIAEMTDLLAPALDTVKALDVRRLAIAGKGGTLPEIKSMLGSLDLAPLVALCGFTAPDGLDVQTTNVNSALNPKSDPLRKLTQSDYQSGALAIYGKQISDPVHKLVDDLKTALMPFKTAIDNIQGILTTLTALPKKIDDAVAKVLDAAQDGIKQVISATIADLQTFQTALTDTLKAVYAAIQEIVSDFSPYWLLNSFSESDFFGYTGAADSTAPGMVAIARRIASGRDTGAVPLAALLQTKLSATQLQLLKSEVAGTTLQAGNHANVIGALNKVLRDASLTARANVDSVKAQLSSQIQTLQPKIGRTIDETRTLYRSSALLRLIGDAWVDFNGGSNQQDATIKLNRFLVEALYSADINPGLTSLHALIVQNVANLYPTQTVQALDDLYKGILDKVRALPDQLIRQPLDDEFNKIKTVLKQSFDISGIFAVLDLKLQGIDDDLSTGLDRLSLAYNHLLTTFDQRLSAAA